MNDLCALDLERGESNSSTSSAYRTVVKALTSEGMLINRHRSKVIQRALMNFTTTRRYLLQARMKTTGVLKTKEAF